MLLVAFLPLPRVRVGPRGGLAQLTAAEEYIVRRCDMTDTADAAAYRGISQSRDTLARPGVVQDAPERTLSVRWSTSASVTVLVAVTSEQPRAAVMGGQPRPPASGQPPSIVASLEMIGPLEASGALPRRCLLRDVWVSEPHRRRGLARRLMLAAEESVSSQGVSFISLEVLGSNAPALALYETLGFTEVEGERSPVERAIVQALPLWLREGIVLGKAV